MCFGRRKSGRSHSWFGLTQPFDQKYRTVTSGIVPPWLLFLIRFVLAIYCVTTCIVHLVITVVTEETADIGNQYYIYFTRLSYVGLTTYFCVAAFQTGIFVLSLRQLKSPEVTCEPGFPLQRWGRFLQFLHLYLFSTIITFPIIVTTVYWTFIADSSTFATVFSSWTNISVHAMNSAFPVIELIFGRLRLYWGYWIFAIITLELYLGLAYLVHTVDHTWVYALLDPHLPNAHVGIYIAGIPIAETMLFVLIWSVIHLRDWIFPRARGVRVPDQVPGVVVIN